jgi:hypothetical protein
MSSIRPDVRAFFERHERAARELDDDALTSLFSEVFLSLDPSAVHALSPQALMAVLPRRRKLLGASAATAWR